jgi:hydrogenase small subunit
MAPFYGRLPNVAGFGIESKVDTIGAVLALGATAGVAAHAVATGVYQIRRRRRAAATPDDFATGAPPATDDTTPSPET